MPGPSNSKSKRHSSGSKPKRKTRRSSGKRVSLPESGSSKTTSDESSTPPVLSDITNHVSSDTPHHHKDEREHVHEDLSAHLETLAISEDQDTIPHSLLQKPIIHDPGNGPRVRDTRAFLSSLFARSPGDDEMSLAFASPEILEMLKTILPEDTALTLWYNKSRTASRICPACQRLYAVGDLLPDLLDSDEQEQGRGEREGEGSNEQLRKEQALSGLCSPLCFAISSLSLSSQRDAIKSAWGRTSEELDEDTWAMLNAPLSPSPSPEGGMSEVLALLVRMTRLHDLGLAQLCLEEEELDEEGCLVVDVVE